MVSMANLVVKKKETKLLHPLIASMINQGDEKNVGLSVVLYAHPMVGKTTFLANLCRHLQEALGRKALYFAIDENLNTPFGQKMRRISRAEWISLDYPHPRTLVNFLNRLKNPEQYCIIVVDSITGLFETLAEEYGDPTHPRINLALIRWSSLITNKLAHLSHSYNLIGILVAHQGAMYEDEWLGRKEKPAFSLRAIKNVDVVLKAVTKAKKVNKKEVLEHYIQVVKFRERPDLRNREFLVEELLGGDIET